MKMIAKDSAALQERVERYIRTRSRDDLNEVMEYAQPFINSAVRSFGNCESERDDYRAEASMSVLEAVDKYRGTARFSTLVHRIAINSAISHSRKENVRKRVTYMDPAVFEETLESQRLKPVETLNTKELAARLMGIVPPRERGLLELYYFYGCTLDDLADCNGKSKGAVKTMLHRAREEVYRLAAQHGLIEGSEDMAS